MANKIKFFSDNGTAVYNIGGNGILYRDNPLKPGEIIVSDIPLWRAKEMFDWIML